MGQHTPGPWHHSEVTPGEDIYIWTEGEEYMPATVHGDEIPPEVALANARLIAAAPSLLAAARTVLADLHGRIEAASAAGQPVPAFGGIADLHDAIVKATGAAIRDP